jgi:hypothetical protein
MEREMQRRKETAANSTTTITPTRGNSVDSQRDDGGTRTSGIGHVRNESAFTIGDDEDSDEEGSRTTQSNLEQVGSNTDPFTGSMSSIDETVPIQLNGMSEKARGKMPVGQSQFSRNNSSAGLQGFNRGTATQNGAFAPNSEWVSEVAESERTQTDSRRSKVGWQSCLCIQF